LPDIFDEVSEDLRAERAQQLFKRYAWAVAALAVAVVVAAGAWQAYIYYQKKQDSAASDTFLAAMRQAQPLSGGQATEADKRAALAGFQTVASSAPPGYRTLARLRAAGLKADLGDLPGALALWDTVAHDDAADPLLRDLANLLWAQHGVDAGDPPVVRARLAALEKPDNPFRALAEEAGALLDLRLGQTDAAKVTLQKLAGDATAPDGVRSRANGLLDRIGIGG
jgi:hypothetical protein